MHPLTPTTWPSHHHPPLPNCWAHPVYIRLILGVDSLCISEHVSCELCWPTWQVSAQTTFWRSRFSGKVSLSLWLSISINLMRPWCRIVYCSKVVYESKPMVNGMSSNGLESVHGTPGKSFLTPPAPANSPVTIATGYNTNTETWAQGGGDAPITSEVMPPSPLTRQPIRSENSAVNTAPTLSPSVQGEGCTETTTITTTETQQTKSDSEQNQEAPDSEKKTTEEKLEIVQGKGNSESATAKETTTAADSTETGSEIDGRNDTKAEADNSGVSRTDQSQEQTQAVTGVEQDTEAQRSVSDSSEQSKNKSASTTVENTDSETGWYNNKCIAVSGTWVNVKAKLHCFDVRHRSVIFSRYHTSMC